MLKVVCAYCGKFLGVKDGRGVVGVSHGCCISCKERVINEFESARVLKIKEGTCVVCG